MSISKVTIIEFIAIMLLVSFPQTSCSSEILNLQKRAVAIDVGHAKNNPGAISCTGIGEYFYNRNIASKILTEVENLDHFKAFMTDDGNGMSSFPQRLQAAKLKKASLLISIHHDSVQPHYLSIWSYNGGKNYYCDKYHGYSIFYSGKNKRLAKSLQFAELLGKELRKKGLHPSLHHAEKIRGENRQLIDKEKGIYRYDHLKILSESEIPSVLLECGVIVNRTEEALLRDTSYQSKIVSAVISAMERYFQINQAN